MKDKGKEILPKSLGSDTEQARRFGERAVEITRYCFDCDAHHDPGFWRYVLDDVTFIGPLPGMDAVMGKEAYQDAISDDLNIWFNYHDSHFYLLYSDGNTAAVGGHTIMKTVDDEKIFILVKQRFTFLFVNVNGTPMIYHVHISDPDNISLDENFPYNVGRELRELVDRMRDSAIIDAMTGLYNRNFLEVNYDELNQALGVDKSKGLVLYMDLNNFKQINDTYGHAAGDAMIRVFGHSISAGAKEVLRQHYVVRAGGDEFIVIAPEDDIKVLIKFLHAIAHHMQEQTKDLKITLTFAAGFAQPRGGRSLQEIISVADHRMYRIKRRYKEILSKHCEDFQSSQLRA